VLVLTPKEHMSERQSPRKGNQYLAFPSTVLVTTHTEGGQAYRTFELVRNSEWPTSDQQQLVSRTRSIIMTAHVHRYSSLEANVPKFSLGSPESRPPLEERTSPSLSSAMSTPPIFSLSNRLLIEIISYLCPNDIFTCRGTCRQLNDLIVNSQLIQYIIRTGLSGVYDPLDPGFSLPERRVALQQWETAWQEVDLRESHARIDAPVPKGRQAVEFSFGRYFVVIREGYGKSASYSFLDMHATSSSRHIDVARWTTIKVETPNVLVFAFASELDLAVAISCVCQSLALSLACSLSASFSSLPAFLIRDLYATGCAAW